MKIILSYLKALKVNNNRDWFNAHKKDYLDAKSHFDEIFNQLIPQIRKFDPEIGSPTAKDCVFRIYHDVRFSKDKLPYKTNMGGFIAKGGRKSGNAGYYLHIEPGNSFIAGGNYNPDSENLKKIRQEIVYNTSDFKKIINKASFVKTFGTIEGDKLKRPPKDFPVDFADMELIKLKSFTVFHRVDDNLVSSKDFHLVVVDTFKELYPLNYFLNRAVAE